MEYSFLALYPGCDVTWQLRHILLAACMLACIYSMVYLVHFQDKLVAKSRCEFFLYTLIVVILDSAFIFLCWKRLTFDEIFVVFMLALMVYMCVNMWREI